ncbi:hypothetical protein J2Y46_003132 [Microbacterium sp. BE35]|uniref:DUF2510 domain-containing protein n=1 Tax=Microbacterium sp. BE35 TaxID=2817773 RepID=UPI002855D584|nr:DUF2510 domain-containing protein [Microbacterium sp. BE35]MDR7190290.1 hypothetical protein [Microbacterium sp. BE35]
MSDGSQAGPPPGWYEDASRADRLRWWDGAAWTEDYRPVATDAAATAAIEVAGAADAAAAPLSRAQSRARRADSDAAGPDAAGSDAAGSAAAVGEAPGIPGVAVGSAALPSVAEEPQAAAVWPAPSSLAEPAEVRDEASVDAPVPVPEPEVGAAKGETFPDQITPRRPAPVDDRPPMPVVYQPVSSSYVGEMRPPLPEAAPANVPARASIVLIAVAALGGLAVVFWLGGWNESIAGLVSLVSVAFAAGAFFLAIGGLIVATQRRTSRLLSGIAIVVSVGLAAWLSIVATQQALAILN